MKLASLRVVLIRPRDPNNIGACARACANFGIRDLAVVAPHPPVWREARSAVGAEELLKGAAAFGSIPEAVDGCAAVLGTSALKARRPGLPVLSLPSLEPARGRTAVLFGPEKTGLTAADLEHCTALVRIPTEPACPSMNLGQAVAVFAYAWRRREEPPAGPVPAPAALRERLAGEAAALAERLGWGKGRGEAEKLARLRRLVNRAGLAADDAGLLLELLRRAKTG